MNIDDELRAADPAVTSADPNMAALRTQVDAQIFPGDPAESVSDHANVMELRGRRSWWVAGSTAAAVALLAVGTLAGALFIGNTDSDVTATGLDAPQSLPTVGNAPGVDMADAERLSIWPGLSITLQPATDLVNQSGVADGYRLNGRAIDTTELARQLASLFAVNGQPRDQDGVVVIGDMSGAGPQIWVNADNLVNWSFSDSSRDPWACAEGTCEDPTVVPAMSEDQAQLEAEQILANLGVGADEADGVDVEWETSSDGVITTATAWQTVAGQRTQLSWSLSFDNVGVLWANGFAAGLEVVPDYPIIGARNAVIRSQIPRWTAFGPAPVDMGFIAMDDASIRSDESTTDSPTLPVAPENARTIPLLWDPAIAVSADLTLAQYFAPDGSFFLLPAYRLQTADDRGEWTIIAVAESAVGFTSVP